MTHSRHCVRFDFFFACTLDFLYVCALLVLTMVFSNHLSTCTGIAYTFSNESTWNWLYVHIYVYVYSKVVVKKSYKNGNDFIHEDDCIQNTTDVQTQNHVNSKHEANAHRIFSRLRILNACIQKYLNKIKRKIHFMWNAHSCLRRALIMTPFLRYFTANFIWLCESSMSEVILSASCSFFILYVWILFFQ